MYENIIEVRKIGTFQRNISTIFLKVLNICLFSKILQKVEIVMQYCSIWQNCCDNISIVMKYMKYS